MHAKTLQIVWHSKEPVFSVDFHPDGYIATAGQDKEVKVLRNLPELRTALVRAVNPAMHGSSLLSCLSSLNPLYGLVETTVYGSKRLLSLDPCNFMLTTLMEHAIACIARRPKVCQSYGLMAYNPQVSLIQLTGAP